MSAGTTAAAKSVGRSTVLVTGASGFLGTALVRRLLAEGVRTRVLVRSPERAGRLAEEGADAVVGDMADDGALDAAVDGVSCVYHLAGRLLVPGVPEEEYRRTHVEGTRRLLARCVAQSDLTRFVHCSTTGVLGVTGTTAADEQTPMRPTNVYEATKAEAELAVRDACSTGLPAVIVRPGLVYGPGDLHLLAFFRAVLRRRFRPIGRRPVLLHPIYIDDMTEALLRCGRYEAAVSECLHVAGPEPVSLSRLAEVIARAGGTTLPPGYIPLPVARVVATVGDITPPLLRRSMPLTRSRLEFLTNSRVYDVTKANRVLDLAPSTDLTTGIELTLAWYRRHGFLPAARAASSTAAQRMRCESETTS